MAALSLLAACAPSPAHTPTGSSPSPTPRTEPAPSPTPTIPPGFREPSIVRRNDGVAEAIGLFTNHTSFTIDDVLLQVDFYDGAEKLVSVMESRLAIAPLGPGASSPYRTRYPAAGSPASARVQVVSYERRGSPPFLLPVETQNAGATIEGGWRVVGTVRGDTETAVGIESFLLAAFEDEELVGLSLPAVAPRHIPAETIRPFEATFPLPLNDPTVRSFLVGTAAPNPADGQLLADLDPGLQLDQGGRPFVVGLLQNPTNRSLSPRLLLELRAAGSTVRVLPLESSIPLLPGEGRPFALRLPDGRSQHDPARLVIRTYLDERRPDPGSRSETLTAQITSAEEISGSYFLRGILRNPHPQQVNEPTLFLALRSTEGELLSAHWQRVADSLVGEGEQAFVLALPLPAGSQIERAEFDLRALGLLRTGE